MKTVAFAPVNIVIRLAKALLTLATGAYSIIVVFGNLTAYQTNYNFIRHVMTMDTTYPDNAMKYRAVHSSRIHHATVLVFVALKNDA